MVNPEPQDNSLQELATPLAIIQGSASGNTLQPTPFLALIRTMRPHQWIKNLVVFGAALFSGHFDGFSLSAAAWASFAFCLLASAIYILNDLFDLKADQEHPIKRYRPIAAGQLPIPLAWGSSVVLFLLGLGLGFWVNPAVGFAVLAYAGLQLAYNLLLKQKAILDIMAIAMGFVLRGLGGAFAVHVVASSWFILCVWLLALYLGIEKRKAELTALGSQATTRKVLSLYSIAWLNRMESIVTSSVLMSYSLWAILEAHSQWMLITIPLVIYGLFKYQNLAEQGAGESPEKALFHCPALMMTLLLWGLVCAAILGFKLH